MRKDMPLKEMACLVSALWCELFAVSKQTESSDGGEGCFYLAF